MKHSHSYPHTCPICGKDFIAREDRIFCSHECAVANRTVHVAGKDRVAALAEKSEKERRRAFSAKLDAEYERNFPGLQSGDVRGRIAAGGRSGVIRDTDTGAIVRRFIAPTSEIYVKVKGEGEPRNQETQKPRNIETQKPRNQGT